MKRDPMIDEFHDFRCCQAKAFGYDIRSMIEDLKKEEKKVAERFVSREPLYIEGITTLTHPCIRFAFSRDLIDEDRCGLRV